MSELQLAPLCYLASPYSKYPSGHVQAFIDVSRIAAELMRAGIKVYSPICHSHPIATFGHIDPLAHAICLPFEERFMEIATVLIVARMPGWAESFGIAHEIEFFERRDRPIYDLNPDTMVMTRRVTAGTEA